MPIQTSFNAGEFSDLMDGAVDLQKRAFSVKVLQNMIALKQGPAVRRGGSVYVSGVKDSSKRVALVPFEFSDAQSYVLEFGDQYIRFYKNYAQITSAGIPVEVSTPYVLADLFDSDGLFQIQFTQSGDVLYLVHGGYAPRVLTRISDTSWSLATLTLEDGPYLATNITATTLALSTTTGTVTVTASTALFASTDIGRLIRFKDPGNNWTWLKITAYTDSTHVTAYIHGPNASAGTATTSWRLGVWSDRTGWPRAVGFFQDRLAMAGASGAPDRYDLSKTGGYSATFVTFQPTDAAGAVADDNAITGNVPSGKVNQINCLASDLRGLVVITAREEFVVRASSLGEAITPSNATSALFSATGGAYIQPVRTVSGTSFAQTARRRMFDIIYSFEKDSLSPLDVTLAAEHITRSQITGLCYQQEPVNVIWAVRTDGTLIGMTHYPDQEVWGWHRHIIGGQSDADGTQAIVEHAAVIPAPDSSRSDLWLVVRRRINGATKRYIEYVRPYYEDTETVETSACVDSKITYSGVATGTISGLGHLEGETVRVMVDGRSHPDLTVTGGQITLANGVTGSVIEVGLPYSWRLVTQKPEVRSPSGESAQGKNKRVSSIIIRLLDTLGLEYGEPGGAFKEYDFNQGATYDESTPLFTGDTEDLPWPAGTGSGGQIELKGSSVFPACVVAIMSSIKVNG